MTDPLALTSQRSTLLRQITELSDFQPGSVTSTFHRCGNPGCHCAKPDDPGHGPHFQITGKIDGKTFTQSLPSLAAVRKAESEIAEFREFKTLAGEVVEVSRKICRLRPAGQGEQTLQGKKLQKRSSVRSPKKQTVFRESFFGNAAARADSTWKRSKPLSAPLCIRLELWR